MSEFFTGISKIPFEGKASNNPMAFKYYNPDEVVGGKTMREQLKFALSWWHTMGGDVWCGYHQQEVRRNRSHGHC